MSLPEYRFREPVYVILAALFVASLVACNLIFLKFFEWRLFHESNVLVISVGILPYPVTFLVTDLLSELYGKKRADMVVVAGFLASIFVVGIVLVADAVTAMEGSPVDDATFHSVFGLNGPAVAASMVAYLTAQFIDIRIFHFWKRLTRGKHLWLRNNGVHDRLAVRRHDRGHRHADSSHREDAGLEIRLGERSSPHSERSPVQGPRGSDRHAPLLPRSVRPQASGR